jgi:hypothetical protein
MDDFAVERDQPSGDSDSRYDQGEHLPSVEQDDQQAQANYSEENRYELRLERGNSRPAVFAGSRRDL